MIVDEKVWEPRQPQDLVRGVKDQQSVQDARPLAPAQFVGPVWTTATYDVPIRSRVIALDSLSSFSVGDLVAIMTNADGGTLFKAYVSRIGSFQLAPEGTVTGIFINVPLPSSVSSGAQIWNYGPIGGGPPTVPVYVPLLFTIAPTNNNF